MESDISKKTIHMVLVVESIRYGYFTLFFFFNDHSQIGIKTELISLIEEEPLVKAQIETSHLAFLGLRKPTFIRRHGSQTESDKRGNEKCCSYVRLWGPTFETLVCCQKIFNFASKEKAKYSMLQVQEYDTKELALLDFDLCISKTKITLQQKSEIEEKRSGKQEKNIMRDPSKKKENVQFSFEVGFFRSMKKCSRDFLPYPNQTLDDLTFFYCK